MFSRCVQTNEPTVEEKGRLNSCWEGGILVFGSLEDSILVIGSLEDGILVFGCLRVLLFG